MIKVSLFAAEERETKLDTLGDVLWILEKHIDFSALAASVDQAAPRPSHERGGRPPFPTELWTISVWRVRYCSSVLTRRYIRANFMGGSQIGCTVIG